MREPWDLTRDELKQIVIEVRDALYRVDTDGVDKLDPDKNWDADTCQEVADTLACFDLLPDEVASN